MLEFVLGKKIDTSDIQFILRMGRKSVVDGFAINPQETRKPWKQ